MATERNSRRYISLVIIFKIYYLIDKLGLNSTMEVDSVVMRAIIDNDLETFKKHKYMFMNIVNLLIEHDRLSFIEYLYGLGYIQGGYIREACRYGRYEIFLFFVSKGELGIYNTVSNAVDGGNMDILLYLRDKGILRKYKTYNFAKFMINKAALEDRLDIVKLLVEEEYEVAAGTVERIKAHEGSNVICRYLHDIGTANYIWGCPNCIHCNAAKFESIESEWYMDSEIYKSTIQWLPKEIVEDTMILI